MKFDTKLITITFLLASVTLAAGSCTKEKCVKCEATTDAIPLKFCSLCYGAPISGTGNDRSCSGGIEITNCLFYNVQNGKPTCVGCKPDSELFVADPAENSTCVTCNVATHYVNASTGICTAATSVPGCARYQANGDKCVACVAGKTLTDAVSPGCETTITNCDLIDGVSATVCAKCAESYYGNGTNACNPTNIANCSIATGLNSCSKCKPGFFATTGSVCDPHAIQNCATGVSAATCNSC